MRKRVSSIQIPDNKYLPGGRANLPGGRVKIIQKGFMLMVSAGVAKCLYS